jgi:hypothetical protein
MSLRICVQVLPHRPVPAILEAQPVIPSRSTSVRSPYTPTTAPTSHPLQVVVEEEIVYTTPNRDPMATPKIRRLRASMHGFYSKGGFFRFQFPGQRHLLVSLPPHALFQIQIRTGYRLPATLFAPSAEHLRQGNTTNLHNWWTLHLQDLTEFRWTNCEPCRMAKQAPASPPFTASTGFDDGPSTKLELATTSDYDVVGAIGDPTQTVAVSEDRTALHRQRAADPRGAGRGLGRPGLGLGARGCW